MSLITPARGRVAGAGWASTGGASVLVAALLFRAGDDGILEGVVAAAAGWAGNRGSPIENDLLKRLPAVLANVFVKWHVIRSLELQNDARKDAKEQSPRS